MSHTLETIHEEEDVARGRMRHRDSTSCTPSVPVIDLALYDHELEEWDSKEHRLEKKHSFCEKNSALHDKRAFYTTQFEFKEQADSFANVDFPSRRNKAKKSATLADGATVEIIVVPEHTPQHSSGLFSSSWHRLLQDHNWLSLEEELKFALAHRHIVIQDHQLLSPESNSSAFHLAAAFAPSDLTLRLLEAISQSPKGNDLAPIERLRMFALCGDSEGNTPLHLACASLEADEEGSIDFSVIKNLVHLAEESLHLINDDGETPIHALLASEAFAKGGQDVQAAEEAMHALLISAPVTLMIQNAKGQTPLHVAIANQCNDRVLYRIVSHGLAAFDIADESGMKPIHYAATYGAPLPCFELMVESVPESIFDESLTEGDTPLHCLAANLNRLLAYYEQTDSNFRKQLGEKSSLHCVVSVLRLLLGDESNAKSPLWLKNDEGNTPLHLCVIHAVPSQLIKAAISALNPYGASIALTTLSESGETPLHCALLELVKKRPQCKQLTSEQRINLKRTVALLTTPMACNAVDDRGRTPLVLAVQSRNPSIAALFGLLKCSAQSAAIPDETGSLALHYACRHKHVEDKVVQALLRVYPEGISHCDKQGNAPLHVACKHCKTQSVISLLIKANPDVLQMRNSKGKRPIERLDH